MSRGGMIPFSHPFGQCWRGQSPSPFNNSPWDSWGGAAASERPLRIFDQNFGLGLFDDDLLPPTLYRGFYIRPRRESCGPKSAAAAATTGLSEVRCKDGQFSVNLDVNQFTPDELTVKTVDNYVVVHGKHEEKVDQHGFISREFTRRYMLPESVLPDNVTSSLSQDGILTIEAPTEVLEPPKANERVVTINRQQPSSSSQPQPQPQPASVEDQK